MQDTITPDTFIKPNHTKETIVTSHYTVKIAIEDIIDKRDLEAAYTHVASIFDFALHPYFIWMKEADKNAFAHSQIPFRYAVEGFSCGLAATVAKIPEFERRVRLADNVAEEHGLVGNKMAHKYTITEFLNAMGVSDNELDIPCPAGVHAFNQSIRNFCLSNTGEAGAALLGIIEYVFIQISNLVATHIVSSGWVKKGSQRHYEVHEILDVEHSEVLFEICKDSWQNPWKREEIGQGLILGGYYFWELYTALYQNEMSQNKLPAQ